MGNENAAPHRWSEHDEMLRTALELVGAKGIDHIAVKGALLITGWMPPAKPATAEGYLANARHEMLERAASRDTPGGERSMGRCVAAFNALYAEAIAERIANGQPPISETMGWEFMSTLKKSRGATGAYREDDYTDDVAYAALAAECAARGMHQ